ncbi:MAG TPA: uroporphyrinogen-III synthase, partial [Ramlibacter sp.]|nr:uroporphyrinogen-III synthase [Ramlibacter sp.]
MAVVLTRPAPEAQRWAERLHERGIAALVLPLLAIGPPADPSELQRAASEADRYGAVMFVSANAVQGFFACAPVFRQARAWAPGPATRDALRTVGVPDARIDSPADDAGQFDSESLWQQVGGQLGAGDRLLLVRGGDGEGRSQGRDWLAQQLASRAVQVDTVVAYTRQAPR